MCVHVLTYMSASVYILFANGPEDQDSNPSQIIAKTQEMVLDALLLKLCIIKLGSRI